MDIKEKDLLEILRESSAIRDEIRRICSGKTDIDSAGKTKTIQTLLNRKSHEPIDENSGQRQLQKEVLRLKELLKSRNEELEQTCQKFEDELSQKKNEIQKLERKLKAIEIDYQNLESHISKKEDAYQRILKENDRIKNEIEQMEQKNIAYEENEKKLIAQNHELEEQMEILENQKNEIQNHFNRVLDKPEQLLKAYRQLSPTIQNGLRNVICKEDEILFSISCSTQEHLKNIWDYIKNGIGNEKFKENEIEILKEIFDYFFDLFNRSLPEPLYKRDDVNVGELFDEDCHYRAQGSSTSGRITEVLLRGYRSNNTNNIICRSYVRI